MTHNAATEIREDVGRRGGLGEDVGGVALAVELGKHKMTSSASLLHKVNIQVRMLGVAATLGRADRLGSYRTSNMHHVSLSAKTGVVSV